MLVVIASGITWAGSVAYIANFGSYDKAYGTRGAIVTFLIFGSG